MSGISTLGQSLTQISRIKDQQTLMDQLQTQIASGKKAPLFTDLGLDGFTSQKARANFNTLDSYLTNITRGDIKIKQMLNSLSDIKTQAKNALDALSGQTQQGNIELTNIKQIASNAFDIVVQNLNAKDGDTYLFGGSNTKTPPIRDTGVMDTFFQTLNNEWSNGTLPFTPPDNITDEYANQYHNMPDVTAGYSGSLVDAKHVFVRSDTHIDEDYTVLANEGPLKDILSVLGAIKNFPDAQDAPGATDTEKQDNYFQAFNELASTLTNAIDSTQRLEFRLNTVQVNLDQASKQHQEDKNILLNTISNVEDADMSEVALKFNTLQIQLEASYRVTAATSDLSLVNYL